MTNTCNNENSISIFEWFLILQYLILKIRKGDILT